MTPAKVTPVNHVIDQSKLNEHTPKHESIDYNMIQDVILGAPAGV